SSWLGQMLNQLRPGAAQRRIAIAQRHQFIVSQLVELFGKVEVQRDALGGLTNPAIEDCVGGRQAQRGALRTVIFPHNIAQGVDGLIAILQAAKLGTGSDPATTVLMVAPIDTETDYPRPFRASWTLPPDGTMMRSNPEWGAPSWTSWSGCGAWASESMRRHSARTR